MKKVCWFDVETTGLSEFKNDVVQLAIIIEIDKKVVAEKEFKMQPFDFDTIEPKALECNGLTVEDLRKYPDPRQTYKELVAFLGKHVNKFDKGDKFHPAGYNVPFDIGFLKQYFKKNGDNYFGSFFNYKATDPLQLLYSMDARGLISLPSYKLVDVCKRFGIPQEKAHDAMCDIQATKNLMEFLGHCIELDTVKLEGGYAEFCKTRG